MVVDKNEKACQWLEGRIDLVKYFTNTKPAEGV